MANISVKIKSFIIYLFKKKNPIYSFSVLNYDFFLHFWVTPTVWNAIQPQEPMSFQLFYFMIDFAELSDPFFSPLYASHSAILHCQLVNYGSGTDEGIKHVFNKQQSHKIRKVLLHEADKVTVIGF